MHDEYKMLRGTFQKKTWISRYCWSYGSGAHTQMLCHLPMEGSLRGGGNDMIRVCTEYFLGTIGFDTFFSPERAAGMQLLKSVVMPSQSKQEVH